MALVFVSKDEDMTKVDVQYLEYKAINRAKEANKYILDDNKRRPKLPICPSINKMRWMNSLRM